MYTGMCEEYRLCTFCDWQKPKSVPKMHSGICLEEEEDDEGGNIIQLGLHVTMHYQWLAID